MSLTEAEQKQNELTGELKILSKGRIPDKKYFFKDVGLLLKGGEEVLNDRSDIFPMKDIDDDEEEDYEDYDKKL